MMQPYDHDVILDCDGVMADFTGLMLDIIADETGRFYGPDDVTQWDFGNLLPDPKEAKRVWNAVKQPGACGEIQPIPGAFEGVQALRDAGVRLYVVTSPMPGNPTWCHERTLWLRDVMGFERNDVAFMSQKHRVRGACLVDDSPDNVALYPGRCVMPAAAYNAGGTYNHHVERVHGWPAIVEATLAAVDAVRKAAA